MNRTNEDKKGNLIVLTLFLAMMSGNYFQYMLSPLAARVMENLNLTQSQFSSVFSAPMLPAIFLGIAAGILADRFGVKKVITIALLIATCAIVIRPFTSSYLPFFLCMVCGGFGSAFLNANNSKIVSRYYSPEKIGNAIGMIMMGSTVGMTAATATSAMFPTLTSAFIVSAVIQVIVMVCWLFFTRRYEQKKAEDVQKSVSLKNSLAAVLKSRHIWIIGLCLTCILGCNTALSSFIPMALQSRGVNDTTAGILASGLMVGNFIGTFLGPRIVSKAPKKRIVLIVCAVISAATACTGWLAPGYMVFAVLLICGFGLGSMMPVLLSMPIQLPKIGPAYAGTAGGVVGTLELLGAVIIPTYIITPLAGGNYYIFFGLSGAVMIVMALIALMIPEI